MTTKKPDMVANGSGDDPTPTPVEVPRPQTPTEVPEPKPVEVPDDQPSEDDPFEDGNFPLSRRPNVTADKGFLVSRPRVRRAFWSGVLATFMFEATAALECHFVSNLHQGRRIAF